MCRCRTVVLSIALIFRGATGSAWKALGRVLGWYCLKREERVLEKRTTLCIHTPFIHTLGNEARRMHERQVEVLH